jgi:bis(5'-nucleosyl)-tetraphosphatase (symmetrical)
VWSGKLTAIQLDSEDLRVVQVPGRDVPAPMPKARPPRPKPQRPHDRPRRDRDQAAS